MSTHNSLYKDPEEAPIRTILTDELHTGGNATTATCLITSLGLYYHLAIIPSWAISKGIGVIQLSSLVKKNNVPTSSSVKIVGNNEACKIYDINDSLDNKRSWIYVYCCK